MSYAQIQKENQIFLNALNKGQITFEQYQQAMASQNQRLTALKTPPSSPINENPYLDTTQNSFSYYAPPADLPKNATVTNVRRQEMTGPLQAGQQRPSALIYEYTLSPKANDEELQAAKQRTQDLEKVGTATAFQGTRVRELSPEQLISSKEAIPNSLSPESKTRYEAWQQERVTTPVKNLGLLLGAAVTAPAIGAAATATSIALGVGVGQGIKTAGGGDLLTPQELYESATGAVIFSGVGKAALAGIAATPIKGLVTGVGQGAAKTVTGIAGRTSVNAGLGAGANYALSGGDPEAAKQGALFGAGFGVLGEGASAAIGKLRGPRGIELIGAREYEVQRQTSGRVIQSTRLTEPVTQQVKMTRAEAEFYKSNMIREQKVTFAGTERAITKAAGETSMSGAKREVMAGYKYSNGKLSYEEASVRYLPNQVESTRSLAPVKAAVQGESYRLAKTQTGRVSDFVESPTDLPAIQQTKVTVGAVKGKGPAIYSEKTIVTPKNTETIFPESKLITRDFTGVKITGKIDPQVYADVAKNLPAEMRDSIYRQLGGQYRNVFEGATKPRDLHGAMKPFGGSLESKKTSIQNDAPLGKAGGGAESTLQTSTPKTVDVQLPRNIISFSKQPPTLVLGISRDSDIISYSREQSFGISKESDQPTTQKKESFEQALFEQKNPSLNSNENVSSITQPILTQITPTTQQEPTKIDFSAPTRLIGQLSGLDESTVNQPNFLDVTAQTPTRANPPTNLITITDPKPAPETIYDIIKAEARTGSYPIQINIQQPKTAQTEKQTQDIFTQAATSTNQISNALGNPYTRGRTIPFGSQSGLGYPDSNFLLGNKLAMSKRRKDYPVLSAQNILRSFLGIKRKRRGK